VRPAARGRLNHPGVVAVHDVIAPSGNDDAIYIVMEHVQARTLAEIIDQQAPLPAPRVAVIGLRILDALDAAHAMGIVHRDVKPGNVLVGDGDQTKLTDFGIALAPEDTTRLTRSGVIGTHASLAPECFDPGQAGPAADLWALGATLFHAVAGRAPFDRGTTTATLRAILFEDLAAPPCDPPLAQVITGLLTRPIEHRISSDAARRLLQPLAAMPRNPEPIADTHPSPGISRSPWESRATALHPRPPGRRPSPIPPGPGRPPATPPPRRTYVAQWHSPRPRPNRTPWIVGGALAATAAVVLVVILAAGRGNSNNSGAGARPPEDPSRSDPASDRAAPEAVALDFLDAINSGDEDRAEGILCVDSTSVASNIAVAIAGEATVQLAPGIEELGSRFEGSLTGTLGGEAISNGFISMRNESDTGWCVYYFIAE